MYIVCVNVYAHMRVLWVWLNLEVIGAEQDRLADATKGGSQRRVELSPGNSWRPNESGLPQSCHY